MYKSFKNNIIINMQNLEVIPQITKFGLIANIYQYQIKLQVKRKIL